MANNFRRGRHCVTTLYAHLVFVTKYRDKLFDSEGLKTLESAMNEVARKMNFKVVEFNGESDHVHLLVEYPPKLSIY
ncbi:MAG: IS200/IS605 family transposase [Symploca sp. SIO3E6]|nr:IS200/IS605 family transposase [Caldora sp. SIO3E6]